MRKQCNATLMSIPALCCRPTVNGEESRNESRREGVRDTKSRLRPDAFQAEFGGDMSKRIFFAFFVCLCILGGLTDSALAKKYNVRSVIAMDFDTGKILFKQNPNKKIAPASLTKVLTLYILWEEIDAGRVKLTDKVKVSRLADRTGGSTMNLKAGEKVTIRELIKGMAVASGNDACVAVAEYLSGSVSRFVKRMNKKAKQLGLKNTHFATPNGLPAKRQLTTARDMLTLGAAYVSRFPKALKIHSLYSITHNGYTRRNSNRLLDKCAGVDGLKTGYVNASGFNIIVTAKRNGRRIMAVVLGGRTKKLRNTTAEKVLETCFYSIKHDNMPRYAQSKPAKKQLVAENKPVKKTRVGQNKKRARIGLSEDVMVDLIAQAALQQADAETSSATYTIPLQSQAPKRKQGFYALQQSGPRGVYTLHESSWQDLDSAADRARMLRRKGFNARIRRVDLGGKGIWHRVLIGDFNNWEAAKRYKRKLSRYGLDHAIILKQLG